MTTASDIFKNPLVERCWLSYISSGKHQEAWDMALVFGFHNLGDLRLAKLALIVRNYGVNLDVVRRSSPHRLQFRSRIRNAVALHLPDLARRIMEVGYPNIDPMRLLKMSSNLSKSDMEWQHTTNFGKEVSKVKNEARTLITMDNVRCKLASDAKERVNKSIAGKIRGRANKVRAFRERAKP